MSIPKTEMRNPESMNFSSLSSEEMSKLVIRANYDAVKACEDAAVDIAKAIDAVADAFNKGGRLFYIGAGTSGRLGIADAAECPPTFGVPSGQVVGIIAGGNDRVFKAGENEEDNYETGALAISERNICENDVVIGISAAGNAAYVLGALEEAKRRGAKTVGLSSNQGTKILNAADVAIYTDTGAEVLTGSTRLKAGTAQKIVLNTISTCAMAKTGKIYENMMINLAPSNEKLRKRVIRIVTEIISSDEKTAIKLLSENNWNIREAIKAYKE